jgi:hypothetical protein
MQPGTNCVDAVGFGNGESFLAIGIAVRDGTVMPRSTWCMRLTVILDTTVEWFDRIAAI